MSGMLRAPFPWFGGKSRVSHLVWNAFGDTANYVEPFAGSLAVLLGRPHAPRIETVNDLDCYLSNFWRALKYAPEEVARWADWPVNEIDLHARHRWLVAQSEFRERMRGDPEFFDARVAGWWVWGICQWIGGGWCSESNWNSAVRRPAGDNTADQPRRPKLHSPNGVHSKRARGDQTATEQRRPQLSVSNGVHSSRARDLGNSANWNKRPSLGKGSRGVQRVSEQMPMLRGDSGAAGAGIHASGLARKLPLLSGGAGHGVGYEGEHEMPADWQCVAWKAAGGYAAAAGNTENSAKERIWFSPHCERAEDQRDLFGGGR